MFLGFFNYYYIFSGASHIFVLYWPVWWNQSINIIITTFTENSAFMSETFTGVYFLFLGIQSKLLMIIMPQILDISRFEKKNQTQFNWDWVKVSVGRPTNQIRLTLSPVAEIAFA